MIEFYKKASLAFLGVLALSAIVGLLCIYKVFLNIPLLYSENKRFPWSPGVQTDHHHGGGSEVRVNDVTYGLDFDLYIVQDIQFPYAYFSLLFSDEEGNSQPKDFSRMSELTFSIKCTPENVLVLMLSTEDLNTLQEKQDITHRPSEAYFSCGREWREVSINIAQLRTPVWWLEEQGMPFSNQSYDLTKVRSIAFGGTFQSPVDTHAKVQIEELNLKGEQWHYFYLYLVFEIVLWMGYIIWGGRAYSLALVNDVKSKVQRDRPLIAYRQLSVEPSKDKNKNALLSYMATEYADADMSLDKVASALGLSRTKINDILRDELGYTFSAYLNKLRLTESARLLAEKEGANVAEIAYTVGYKNPSYFNRLFKEEYGCTPKVFKSVAGVTGKV